MLSSAGAWSGHYGHITKVDALRGLARVKIPDLELETYWLKLPVQRSKGDRSVDWMDVGTFVFLMADERLRTGSILCAHYDESNMPPIDTVDRVYREFEDGSVIEFDRAAGVLKLDIRSRIEITVTGGLHITNEAESTINGKAIVVIGGRDDDTESNGPDTMVTSGQDG